MNQNNIDRAHVSNALIEISRKSPTNIDSRVIEVDNRSWNVLHRSRRICRFRFPRETADSCISQSFFDSAKFSRRNHSRLWLNLNLASLSFPPHLYFLATPLHHLFYESPALGGGRRQKEGDVVANTLARQTLSRPRSNSPAKSPA